MKRLIISILIVVLLNSQFGLSKEKVNPPENYKKWIEEEVAYIITSKEKSVFLQLKTDRERDIFIEAFWKQRDPTSGTARNEFKEEHYRRVSYANEYFGRGTPRPGWKTDQGRIYIVLGKPNSIETYENVMNVRKAIDEKNIKIVNGKDIMEAFNLKPSPLIGKLIEAGNEYAVQENIQDKKSILDFLKSQYELNE